MNMPATHIFQIIGKLSSVLLAPNCRPKSVISYRLLSVGLHPSRKTGVIFSIDDDVDNE